MSSYNNAFLTNRIAKGLMEKEIIFKKRSQVGRQQMRKPLRVAGVDTTVE